MEQARSFSLDTMPQTSASFNELQTHAEKSESPSLANGKLKFAKDSAGFLNTLKGRVDEYFQRTGKSRNDCWQMYLKSVIILSWFAASYIALVFFTTSIWVALPLAVLLGVAMSAVGFSIQQDRKSTRLNSSHG